MFNSFEEYQAGFNDMQGVGFDEGDQFPWDGSGPPLDPGPMFRNNRRARYGNAYGNYQGGYGPGMGYGPRPFLPPPPPPPLPPPKSSWDRGLHPARPPRWHAEEDRVIKYLVRCGVSKEYLKNLPYDMLRLIQPEHCGLCDFPFDSFSKSRMHYISKNHLRNHKKWLSKSMDPNSYKEIPFKARNLYCELCDIQITSKSHGEAHYAGKPHRGIVDGRKKPKNPLLLQNNMQHRLEQLIRREKRCLKPTPKVAEEEQVKTVKVISPELYCDICKTSVTCSDQMTTHMNGKRHLTKEKHHILNMMKGKTESKQNVNLTDDTVESVDEDEADQVAEEETSQANGNEWGTEAWENED